MGDLSAMVVIQTARGNYLPLRPPPKLIDEPAAGFTVQRRHVLALERLNRRLMGAYAENVPIHLEFVDRVPVVVLVHLEAGRQKNAFRMHVHFVRVRRHVIGALTVKVGGCDNRLAGRLPKLLDRFGNTLEFAQPAAAQAAEFQDDSFDAGVVFRELQAVNDVLDQRLRFGVVEQFRQRPVIRVAFQLLNQRTHRRNHQRRAIGQTRRRRR